MKLLLHICCAPCSVACVKSLRSEGIEPTGYWYNPNIHPYTEYRTRRDTLTEYAKTINLALVMEDEYGLRPFTRAVAENIADRCPVCYAARMRQTARYAAENGYTHFTSTLFISPYQRHSLLRAAAEQAAQEFGVAFLYRDFRPVFRQGQEEARALNLYMQKYCGCVFSEEERYRKAYQKKNAARAIGESDAAQTEAEAQSLRAQAMPGLYLAGLRFDAARAAETRSPSVPPHASSAPTDTALCAEVAQLLALTERALWEVRNVLRCAADSGLWEHVYCGAPVWRHAYHMLHSLDQWFINPMVYTQPPIHQDGLNDLDCDRVFPTLSPAVLEDYLAAIATRLRAYLATLTDGLLTACPEGCPYARMTLIVGQMRHLHTHQGMLMGFIIAQRGAWPAVLGTQLPLPTQDDGVAHYC